MHDGRLNPKTKAINNITGPSYRMTMGNRLDSSIYVIFCINVTFPDSKHHTVIM